MLRRLLVALDPDPDSSLATRYAILLAKRFDAELFGLAVVDTKSINAEISGGSIGAIYYADQLRRYLSNRALDTGKKLINSFKEAVDEAEVKHAEWVKQGVPFKRIMEDMKYHDMLVVGRNSHFLYNRPEERTKTLAKVVKDGVAPVLVVGDTYRAIDKVLIAYDGSDASARSMQCFAHIQPFGDNISLDIMHVRPGNSDIQKKESDLLLSLSCDYMKAHGFNHVVGKSLENGNAGDQIITYADDNNVDLIVAGAHSVSAIRRVTFGSTTYALLEESSYPLFLYH